MSDISDPEEVAARVRRHRARLTLGDREVVRQVDAVDDDARRVLLVNALGEDPVAARRSLRELRDRLAVDAEVRVLGPEFVGESPQGRWKLGRPTDRTAVVHVLRDVGWTVVAIERFDVGGHDGFWVDLTAREVVPRVHRDG
ncbi:MAG: hypothetical protein KJN63_05730 [Acidimicrobiia bacterium]|nr:hypothetical protein [Acidimicrobiia bacterium]